MTEVCTPIIRFVCFLVATLSLFTSALEANAGVRITMADDLESGRHFLVISTIFNRGFDSFSTDRLDSFFLTRGEKKDITVLATIPFIYDHVSAIAVHPAYYGDGTRPDKMPFALRTVILPTLRPLSWRNLLDSGAISERVGSAAQGDQGMAFTETKQAGVCARLDGSFP